jgi:tetratricopeptide (TPR) repeat protein
LEWAQEKHAALNQARLSSALWRFWWVRSYFSEGRRWLATALAQDLPIDMRIKCLYRAAFLANYQGDFTRGSELCQACVGLSEQSSDLEGTVMGHVGLIQVHMLTGKGSDGLHHLDPALNAAQLKNDRWLLGMVHFMAANAHLILNQHRPALDGYRQALALFNAIGDQWMIMNTQLQLIWTSFVMGVSDEAVRAAEVLGLCRSFGDKRNTARMLIFIGEIELKTNRPQTARARLSEGIKLFHEIGEVFWGTVCLESFGRALVGAGEHSAAAAIFGYTDQHYTRHKMPRLDYFQVEFQRAVEALQSTLPGPDWETAQQQGQSKNWDEIVRFALASNPP